MVAKGNGPSGRDRFANGPVVTHPPPVPCRQVSPGEKVMLALSLALNSPLPPRETHGGSIS